MHGVLGRESVSDLTRHVGSEHELEAAAPVRWIGQHAEASRGHRQIAWAQPEEGAMKAFTAAAIQIAPLPGPLTPETVKGNLAKAGEWVERCVDATGAELVVLPESGDRKSVV